MKAIIMAGGEGSRLRPLTCDCPKPMLPLMGKPLMEYALHLLKEHGITEIAVTLGYLPDAVIDYFGDGSDFGVQLHYFIEKTPLGTAGSVKQAQDFLTERFIVLSGDGITDINLQSALDFHQKNDAHATLILKKCSNPQEYGMVVTDTLGRIKSFHEKPGRCDIFSDLINTGIYILEPELLQRIPENRPFDFGHEFFPALLQEDTALYGFADGGYWCDVGDVPAYLQVHMDAMDGKIQLDSLTNQNGVCADGAVLESGCRLDAPCFVGKGSQIAAGAHIGPYTVIGENCLVEAAAGVKRSVLFNGVHVEAAAQLRGCIAGQGVSIGKSAQLYEDSVVGSHSHVGERAILSPGVKLWPDKSLPDGVHPDHNIVWGQHNRLHFTGNGLVLFSPVDAARCAQACASVMQADEILLGRTPSAQAQWHAAAAGLLSLGIRVIDAAECTLPQLRHMLLTLRTKSAFMATENALIPLCASGAPLNEKKQRAILKRSEHPDACVAGRCNTASIAHAGDTSLSYTAHVASAFRADPAQAPHIALFAQSEHLLKLATQAFARSGLRTRCEYEVRNMHLLPNEIAVFLSEDGQQAVFADANGRMDEAHRQLLLSWTALQMGQRQLILHNSATRAIAALAADYAAKTIYLSGEQAHWCERLFTQAPLQANLHFDGIFSALACLSALTEAGLSLRQWQQTMPEVHRKTASIPVPSSECGRLLHIISAESPLAELGGGVRLCMDQGWAWLSPDERFSRLQIIAESMQMETASDICTSLEAKIRNHLKK